MKECVVKAEGCHIYFNPINNSQKICKNPLCKTSINKEKQAIRNRLYRKQYKNHFPDYQRQGSQVFRPCLGPHCRGKNFWSNMGARICDSCKSIMEEMENDVHVMHPRNKKTHDLIYELLI